MTSKEVKNESHSELEKLCEQKANEVSTKNVQTKKLYSFLNEVNTRVPIQQPTLVSYYNLSNPYVNSILRKLVKSNKLRVDRTSKPYSYYRVE